MSDQESPSSDDVKAMIRQAALAVAKNMAQTVPSRDAALLTAAAAFFSAPAVADALDIHHGYFTALPR
jgi:hypothetical protein